MVEEFNRVMRIHYTPEVLGNQTVRYTENELLDADFSAWLARLQCWACPTRLVSSDAKPISGSSIFTEVRWRADELTPARPPSPGIMTLASFCDVHDMFELHYALCEGREAWAATIPLIETIDRGDYAVIRFLAVDPKGKIAVLYLYPPRSDAYSPKSNRDYKMGVYLPKFGEVFHGDAYPAYRANTALDLYPSLDPFYSQDARIFYNTHGLGIVGGG